VTNDGLCYEAESQGKSSSLRPVSPTIFTTAGTASFSQFPVVEQGLITLQIENSVFVGFDV
jgi:hypothetical protein